VVTSAQIRMARAAVQWTVRDLAERSGVHRNTVTRIEAGNPANGPTMAALERALEAAGIEFTNGDQPGVRMKALVYYGEPTWSVDDRLIVWGEHGSTRWQCIATRRYINAQPRFQNFTGPEIGFRVREIVDALRADFEKLITEGRTNNNQVLLDAR